MRSSHEEVGEASPRSKWTRPHTEASPVLGNVVEKPWPLEMATLEPLMRRVADIITVPKPGPLLEGGLSATARGCDVNLRPSSVIFAGSRWREAPDGLLRSKQVAEGRSHVGLCIHIRCEDASRGRRRLARSDTNTPASTRDSARPSSPCRRPAFDTRQGKPC